MSENLPALSNHGEAILRERVQGSSVRELARRYKCSSDQINLVLDSMLERVSEAWRMRQIGIEIERLDALVAVYFAKAEAGDPIAGSLYVKLAERRAHLAGLDHRSVDAVQLQLHLAPPVSSVDKIMDALNRLRIGNGGTPSDETTNGSSH